MSGFVNRYSRKLHRWGAILIALPLLLVIVSGLLLQLKKQLSWVQPPTKTGSASQSDPRVDWDQILASIRSVPEAQAQGWQQIERIDVQPKKGIAKVQLENRWEIQIDLQNGRVLSSSYRRSDFIESLHDGTFFGDWAKLGIFLPNGIVLLGLWLTGLYLWYLPIQARAKKKSRQREIEKSS